MTNPESKTALIDRLYDEGKPLVSIVRAVGTDDDSIKLIASRLGCSTKPGTKLDYAKREVEATTTP